MCSDLVILSVMPCHIIRETLTTVLLCLHRFLINASHLLLRARHSEGSALIHHWPSARLLILSIAQLHYAHLCLFPPLSCSHVSGMWALFFIKYHTQNYVLLYSSAAVIQSKFHQHCNQSQSVLPSFTILRRDWRVRCQLAVIQQTPAETLGLEGTVSWGQFILFCRALLTNAHAWWD